MEEAQAWRTLERAARANAARGSLLFHLDLATELARATLTPEERGAGTLVATVDGEGYGVACVEEGAPARVRAFARFDKRGAPLIASEPAPASGTVETMAAARRTLAAAKLVGAGNPQRVLVIPPEDGAEVEAYAIRWSERPDEVVLGVHWRARLSGDGRRLLARKALSRRAMTISAPRPPDAVEVTHFGATPGEIHTYLSLKHGLAFEVLALESRTRWRVSGERSELLGSI